MRKDRCFAKMLDLESAKAPYVICFLLKEAQTLKGDIARMEKALVEYPGKIAERQKTLASIDAVLALHPTPALVSQVPAVKRRTYSLLPYGKLSQVVLRALREAKGEACTTFELAMRSAQIAELRLNRDDFRIFHKSVLKSINHLRKTGLVESPGGKSSGGGEEAQWRLIVQEQAA